MDEYQQIGARLRQAREALGYTQQRLADEIGVAASTYSRYESGAQKITIPELRKVAALLGIPFAQAAGGEAPDPMLVPDLASRVVDLLKLQLPAIVGAAVDERLDAIGRPKGKLARQGTLNTEKWQQASNTLRPRYALAG